MVRLTTLILTLLIHALPPATAAPAPLLNTTSPPSLNLRATSPGRWEHLGGVLVTPPTAVPFGDKIKKLDVFGLGTDQACW